MMNDNERDELWTLLGKVKQPEVSPFFARNVLREIRNQPQSGPKTWWTAVHSILRPTWAIAAATAMVAIVMGGIQFHNRTISNTTKAAAAAADQMSEEDISVVVDLDELLASQDTDLWIQNNSSL